MVRLSEPSRRSIATAQRRQMERLLPCAPRIVPVLADSGNTEIAFSRLTQRLRPLILANGERAKAVFFALTDLVAALLLLF